MKLSTKGQYAVMAIVDLARHSCGELPIPLSVIAKRQRLPIQYLEQLFLKLRRNNLVCSIRGPSGGYLLQRQPKDIYIGEVINAVDEPISTTRCQVGSHKGCNGENEKCLTHALWVKLGVEIENYLNSVTLEDICKKRI